MAEKDANQAVVVQRFRDSFKACLEENRVRPDRPNFYLKWAQALLILCLEKNRGIVEPDRWFLNWGRFIAFHTYTDPIP